MIHYIIATRADGSRDILGQASSRTAAEQKAARFAGLEGAEVSIEADGCTNDGAPVTPP